MRRKLEVCAVIMDGKGGCGVLIECFAIYENERELG